MVIWFRQLAWPHGSQKLHILRNVIETLRGRREQTKSIDDVTCYSLPSTFLFYFYAIVVSFLSAATAVADIRPRSQGSFTGSLWLTLSLLDVELRLNRLQKTTRIINTSSAGAPLSFLSRYPSPQLGPLFDFHVFEHYVSKTCQDGRNITKCLFSVILDFRSNEVQ